MPLDILQFRINLDVVRESQRRRFGSMELIDEIVAKDERWRSLTGLVDETKAKRNRIQKEVAVKMKAKEPADEMAAVDMGSPRRFKAIVECLPRRRCPDKGGQSRLHPMRGGSPAQDPVRRRGRPRRGGVAQPAAAA